MKQYFAKYLPVEGEIKEGDYYSSATGIYKHTGGKNYVILSTYKKVKLFLCSRDIKVGDKVFCFDVHLNNPLHPPERYIDPWRIRTEGDTCNACIKVIGEISPNAIWVKEGDEFEERDISRRGCLGDLILIKCPCCGDFK